MDALLPLLLLGAFALLVATFTAPEKLRKFLGAGSIVAVLGIVALYVSQVVSPLETPEPAAVTIGPEVFVILIGVASLAVLIGIAALFVTAVTSLRKPVTA